MPSPQPRPRVLAHRGASGVAPQNTFVAFDAAVAAGADGIETDLRLTRDGVAVVIHDVSVDATTDGTGRVEDLDVAEVLALDAGSWKGPEFAGQRVPTFAQLVAWLLDHPGFEVLLELKGDWSVEQVRPVTDAIDAAGLGDRVVPKSFWPPTVLALRDAAPHLRRGLLVELDSPEIVDVARELGVWTCNPDHALLARRPDLVPALHAEGIRAMVWSSDTPEAWQADVDAGVDAIMTDHPARLLAWLGTLP